MHSFKEEIVSANQIRSKTIIWLLSFSLLFATIIIAAYMFSRQWNPKKEGTTSKIPDQFRSVLNTNENIFSYFFSSSRLTKTFPKSKAVKEVRVNGSYGMNEDFDPAKWKLELIRKPGDTLYITIDEIKSLPKTNIIFDFKCIEGWSQITHWAGVKFSDFVKKYGLDVQSRLGYAGLSTPDKKYYVGIDSKSILHPQTILAYEMNGKNLPFDQGAPLRLIIPVKYGVKHLKRIGTIYFSTTRTPDYWYEKGYDYYCGL